MWLIATRDPTGTIELAPIAFLGTDETRYIYGMMRSRVRGLLPVVLSFLILVAACSRSPVDSSVDQLPAGTWGGNNAGLILNATSAHVHIGCTLGDFPAPVSLDADGRFAIDGSYLLTAYPVAHGPHMPAQLGGVLRGKILTVSVAVHDTIANRLVILGPSAVVLGRDPNLGPCPICEVPGDGSALPHPHRPGWLLKAWRLLVRITE